MGELQSGMFCEYVCMYCMCVYEMPHIHGKDASTDGNDSLKCVYYRSNPFFLHSIPLLIKIIRIQMRNPCGNF